MFSGSLRVFSLPSHNEQAPLSGKVETLDKKMDLLWTLDKVNACLKMQLFSWQVSIHLKVLLPPQSPVIVWDSANTVRFLPPTRDPMKCQ